MAVGVAEVIEGPGGGRRRSPGSTPLAIEATGLVKHFGATRAVAGVDLAASPGTVYGLLGPNGAGKTTIVRILATLLAPDGGRAMVLGHDVAREASAVRRRVALAGQFTTVDDDLTGSENLVLLGWLAGLRPRPPTRRAAGRVAVRPRGARSPPPGRSSHSPAGCAAPSTWPPASLCVPICSSLTSRTPAWTRKAAPKCGS